MESVLSITDAISIDKARIPSYANSNSKDVTSWDCKMIKRLTSRNQFVESIKVIQTNKNTVVVELIPRKKKSGKGRPSQGCRAAGLIMSALLDRFSSIETLPTNVFVICKAGFEKRGYLTLHSIGNASIRNEFEKNLQIECIPFDSGSYKEYENYARNKFNKANNTDCRNSTKLKVDGLPRAIQSDGFDENKKMIIEIKKGMPPNFTEGISELIQNYTIVKIKYPAQIIKTRLITSKPKEIDKNKLELFERSVKFLKCNKNIIFKILDC